MRNALLMLIFVVLAVLSFSCSSGMPVKRNADLSVYMNPEFWKNEALTEIIPFWEKSIDRKNGGFYSTVNSDGTPGSDNTKYVRMISRIVYAYSTAYLLSGDDKYLELAAHGLDFQTNYGWDQKYGGWYLAVQGKTPQSGGRKNLFDETYGNLGPVQFYFTTHDKNALSYVSKTHELMQTKAWDAEYGGYYAEVGADWTVINTTKSFNSQMDTCSAYLMYYYLATKDPKLLEDIKAVANVAVEKMVSKTTGFVGETFNQAFKSLDSTLWVGHNLKTAWILMRTYWLTGDKQYAESALKITEAQTKYNWDPEYGGWYFQFPESMPTMSDKLKDWWTQTEGNFLMLNLYRMTNSQEYLTRFSECASFWDNFIMDHKDLECWPNVTRNGSSYKQLKGHMYKSGYHTMEHALHNYLYLSFYVKKTDAELFFRLSADKAGEKHYVIPVEYPGVFIRKVEIDGKDWKGFNAVEGSIDLPAGIKMKVKVTYGTRET